MDASYSSRLGVLWPVATYHLRVKMPSRRSGVHAAGRAAYRSGTYSVVSAAAYRAGEKLVDTQQGVTFDYPRKSGVEYSAIMAPDNAPSWVYDRQALWNAVEASEKRINSRLARELEIMLPRELSAEQCVALVRRYVQAHCVSKGMVADIAIHRPDASDGKEQPHAHVLLTTRSISPAGFDAKVRDWDSKERVHEWREAWSEFANRALHDAGSAERIDHRRKELMGTPLKAYPHLPRFVALGQAKALSQRLQAKVAKWQEAHRHNRLVATISRMAAKPLQALQRTTAFLEEFMREPELAPPMQQELEHDRGL